MLLRQNCPPPSSFWFSKMIFLCFNRLYPTFSASRSLPLLHRFPNYPVLTFPSRIFQSTGKGTDKREFIRKKVLNKLVSRSPILSPWNSFCNDFGRNFRKSYKFWIDFRFSKKPNLKKKLFRFLFQRKKNKKVSKEERDFDARKQIFFSFLKQGLSKHTHTHTQPNT